MGRDQPRTALVHRLVTNWDWVSPSHRAELVLLKIYLPYRESGHVVNIAYNVRCVGATRLAAIGERSNSTILVEADEDGVATVEIRALQAGRRSQVAHVVERFDPLPGVAVLDESDWSEDPGGIDELALEASDISRETCRVARDCCDDQAARLECICNRLSDTAARSGDDRDAPAEVHSQTLTGSRG